MADNRVNSSKSKSKQLRSQEDDMIISSYLQSSSSAVGLQNSINVVKPPPPFINEQVFDYVPSWLGGQNEPNAHFNKLVCQVSYYILVFFLIFMVARWNSQFDDEVDR